MSAHAPHAERPDHEATAFWEHLKDTLYKAPPGKGLVLGLDANADLVAPDETECLVGPLLGRHEPTRNDGYLLECCLQLGLEAPATFPEFQRGAGWSWQHTTGSRKRLDHVLFKSGPWRHQLTCQAIDFDLGVEHVDHVALRARSVLNCGTAAPAPPRQVRCHADDAHTYGAAFWRRLGSPPVQIRPSVTHLLQTHKAWMADLPARPRLPPRQPYVTERTLALLARLRDWRAQHRSVQTVALQQLLRVCLQGWRQLGRDPSLERLWLEYRHIRLTCAALQSQVARIARHAHDSARHDKAGHFLQLTQGAAAHWHATGRPMEAIIRLKWASRRAAERRAVHAAGGYHIGDALEAQFRDQEGGQLIVPERFKVQARAWLSAPAAPCPAAMPTLLDMEASCLRQARRKAPGPDGIPNELRRCQPEAAGLWFWHVCAGIAAYGHEPLHFKLAIVCALYEKGPASLPQNYRSIALLSGMAKIWHGHVRQSLGQVVLSHYDPLQLGGRRGIPVSFAVSAYRAAMDMSVQLGRSTAVLFIDTQAAYYEASRQLIFEGDPRLAAPEEQHLHHVAGLVHVLAHQGALAALGVPAEEVALLKDCVELSHWHLAGSSRTYLASRGSRPGDGLADVLFGALFSIALRHIRRVCLDEGWGHAAAGSYIGRADEVLPLGWADDLAISADFPDPNTLCRDFPRIATVALTTLRFLRFRVNLGSGKTEAMLDIRGPGAKSARGELLGRESMLDLPTGDRLRLTPEYRYLGVVQSPKDTGRRDMELNAQRAQSAWAHARAMLASAGVPWSLKRAWLEGRVLPAAYATIATSTAVSARALAPLEGFYERASRHLVGSWRYAHCLTKPLLYALLGLTAPQHATIIARARLVLQLVTRAPAAVFDLVDAAWSRGTDWCLLLADACRQVWTALPHQATPSATLSNIRAVAADLGKACKFLSRWGTLQKCFCDLWADLHNARTRRVIGDTGTFTCDLCRQSLPSKQALAAHIHKKHSVVNCITKYTHGTVCLWCNCELHSTDRLKYHLRVTYQCMYGLRVTVGEAYQYGSGTKRSGQRAHRGLPPIRLPGPQNATPAQRRAAAEGRMCTADELRSELQAATGASSPWEWPRQPAPEPTLASPCAAVAAESQPALNAAPDITASPASSLGWEGYHLQWRTLWLSSTLPRDDVTCPSPLWHRLVGVSNLWQLPGLWHRWWKLWWAAHQGNAWSFQHRRAFHALRSQLMQGDVSSNPSTDQATSSAAGRTGTEADPQPLSGPPAAMIDLLEATVTFRHVCNCVNHGGMLWILGAPSRPGLSLLRALLPSALFHFVNTDAGTAFVAAHPSCLVALWRAPLCSLFAVRPKDSPPTIAPMRASFVYRPGSLD